MPRRLTYKELNKILDVWISRLNLGHWEITIFYDKPMDNPECQAEIAVSPDYEEAEVYINPDKWQEWTRAAANKVVAHELLHIHLDQIKEAAEECRGTMGNDTWYLYQRRLNHELEHAVEALALMLCRQLGTV